MRLCVVGTGYVGLVTGACLADVGCSVVCVDANTEKVDRLRSNHVPFYEPGLAEIVERTALRGRLSFTSDLSAALEGADAVFLAVGTPPREDGSADLHHIEEVAHAIGQGIQGYTVVVVKSTVPVGTASRVRQIIADQLQRRGVDIAFDVASNPEFLKEGTAVVDFLKPERIVVGTDSQRSKEVLTRIYRPFVLNNHPVIFMDTSSAELTKYAANVMLATRISMMNLLAEVCEAYDADIGAVRLGMGSDSRIGPKFLYPGIGYGGSCFPKDVRALAALGEAKGIPMDLLRAVELVNVRQKSAAVAKLREAIPDLTGTTVAVWGIAFKPNTDDVREAPALDIIRTLHGYGVHVRAFDPAACEQARIHLGEIYKFADDPYDALVGADALILATEWSEFRNPDPAEMGKRMRGRVIIDGRNVLDAKLLREHGFQYFGIGLKKPVEDAE